MSSYRSFLKLLRDWPVDPTKTGGRDLGEYMSFYFRKVYDKDSATQVDEVYCASVHASLNRIATNTYKTRYPRKLTGTAVSISKEEINQTLSKDFLAFMDQETKKSIFTRVKDKIINSKDTTVTVDQEKLTKLN